ncbi:MAG: hypothetical protein U0003_03310 [Vampirovibrionales bacterium]
MSPASACARKKLTKQSSEKTKQSQESGKNHATKPSSAALSVAATPEVTLGSQREAMTGSQRCNGSLVAQSLLDATGSVPAAVAALKAQLAQMDAFWQREQRRHKAMARLQAAQQVGPAESLPEDAALGDGATDVSTSITQTWTDQAIKCYVTQADCAHCSIPRGGYSFACQMNKVVPVLLDTLGRPDALRLERLTPYLDQY